MKYNPVVTSSNGSYFETHETTILEDLNQADFLYDDRLIPEARELLREYFILLARFWGNPPALCILNKIRTGHSCSVTDNFIYSQNIICSVFGDLTIPIGEFMLRLYNGGGVAYHL